ncbi:protein of unknown function [Desulfatibacillum alkenivorans DSM 16219]|jgi:hypothetical protein|uniref:PatA-like N-terminal domain-containing protein n=1 Tax=Desulfatibacillum alkenivorans DSM 16219 TaxID=1121393 RepID=A0A1M6SW21_9BACT|nr:DUF4388 domain-containing protein [Desulfatibacillum alkenivorans]SHK48768.1 protein of unknown function [Desulfatibacillum alkenivorans DSM 16219]
MALNGNLDSFFFASLLQHLAREKLTGVLRIVDGQEEARVFVKEGTIIYAVGSHKEARLGHLLRSQGIISVQELQKCAETAKEEKKLLGKVLVEKGYISSDTFKKFIEKQIREILYNLFFWKKGEFHFKETPLKLEEDVVVHLNTIDVILEASRRIDELDIIRKQLPDEDAVLKISDKSPDKKEIKLDSNEWHILSLIDGKKNVGQIVHQSGFETYPVYKLLFSLLSSGLIRKVETVGLTGKNRISDQSGLIIVHNDVLGVVYKALHTELGAQANSVFDNSKSKLSAKKRIIFHKFSPTNPAITNVQVVREGLDSLKLGDPSKAAEFLLEALNDYLTFVLENTRSQIGASLTQDAIAEAQRVLSYVDKYHEDSDEKDYVVSQIQEVLAEAIEKVGAGDKDKKSGGLFGRFKKK